MSNPMLPKLVRFQRPDRALPWARPDRATEAAVFGTDLAGYEAALADLGRQRDEFADRLAADEGVAERLRRLPFAVGERIVAIGESTTADRLSWFEVLRTLIDRHRPDLRLGLTNLAVSGASTTGTLAGLAGIRRQPADRVFILLGGNDIQRCGVDGPRLVSEAETERNLRVLRERASDDAAQWIWLTPPPVDEAAVAAFPFFGGAGLHWSNDDVRRTAGAVRRIAGDRDLVIDTSPAVTGPESLLEDGVHPQAATQAAVAGLVLEALSR
ncbi:hypothetical protein FCG67_18090 [Rhodococcus oryzae]|uniref:SGNH hydrolase-type esterase domain-containing protein n=1 Tax=Rhodococcus oryzae TaxID=2571143 RepID=A0ABY2RIW4_9NOCA|nr:GDSL-type esterase/lipase family protein [Rhodococcus oryzae]TJZ75937.1 hypothetical protein FCG67_18090 [Rhodococcus oryzae]